MLCFHKEETSQKLVHHGGAMIMNVNVMVYHQAVMRSVIRNVIGVVAVIAEMTVSVMSVLAMIVPAMIVPAMSVPVTIVSVMSVLVTSVPVMIAPVTRVQVS